VTSRRQTRRSKCPVCGRAVAALGLEAEGDYPFCSRRCKLTDLGEWFDGERRISIPLAEEEQ